jgi:type 1 glutamine amidotransferase
MIQPLRLISLAAIVLFCCLVSATRETTAAETKLKGLLVTGGCCHDYPRQTKIITEGLSQRVNISWDVVHEDDGRLHQISIYAKAGWSKGYDIVVHNECYGAVADVSFVENIVNEHTKNNVPAIVIHCSMHSYRAAETDEWRKFLGVTSRRHEKGGRRLKVTNTAKGHPIMAKFPAEWTTPNGELYVIENVWPNCVPLATAYGEDTKKEQICIWVNTYKNTRLFGTTLGHHNETMISPHWLDTTARGLLWTLGKLDEDGNPVAGFAGTGIAMFSFQKKIDTRQPTPAGLKLEKGELDDLKRRLEGKK